MDNRNYDGILWSKDTYGYWVNKKHGRQHVYVWQQAHQATIDKGDVIHHINEDKEDNRIDNLQLMTKEEHTRLHQNGNQHCLGRKCSTETITKMRGAAVKGWQNRDRVFSNDVRAKMSESHKNISDETRQKMSVRMRRASGMTTNTSGYKGVYWNANRKKWHTQIKVNKNTIYLGQYSDAEQAARAYDSAARKYFGDDCFLNFPQDNLDSTVVLNHMETV